MKPRHQIKFGPRPSIGKQVKTIPKASLSDDASGGTIIRREVTVGMRQLQFARALSDTEKHVRDSSLQSLRSWLGANAKNMNSTEMDKLWKALFYCVWMADKRKVITSVIINVVDLSDIAGWSYLESLFSCLIREWFGIDRHRVDKYYELISYALKKCVASITHNEEVKTYEKFEERRDRFLELMCSRIWQPSRKAGVGLALHVLDVHLDVVLKPVLKKAKELNCGAPRLVTTFNAMMDDIITMTGARVGWPPSLSRRVQERVLGRLIELVTDEELELTRVTKRRIVDRAAKQVFKVASDKETEADIRKDLYELHVELKGFVHECENTEEDQQEHNEVDGKTGEIDVTDAIPDVTQKKQKNNR